MEEEWVLFCMLTFRYRCENDILWLTQILSRMKNLNYFIMITKFQNKLHDFKQMILSVIDDNNDLLKE